MSNAISVPRLSAGHPAILTVGPTKHELKPNPTGVVQSTVIL